VLSGSKLLALFCAIMRDTVPVRVRFGDFELDLRTGELHQGGGTIPLQQQPFRVLLMLVERGGEIATREEIQKRLWPNDTVVEFDQSINAVIKKLRKALGDSVEDPKYIKTFARLGYRLMVPVERVAADPADEVSSGIYETALRSKRASSSLTGKTVSHYRVLEIVGGGGMGVVYRAEDLKLGRAVALKFLPEELGDDSKALERFEREARAASALDHPNICSIYEFGEHEGQPFIVMQLLEGETLRDRLASAASEVSAERAFSVDQLVDAAVQIATGLEAAHERGIIHRDIKPANIFLTNRGLVKILDFGVAQLMEIGEHSNVAPEQQDSAAPLFSLDGAVDALNATRTGMAIGTTGYMSPEQARGERLDARTDLFSFGLVLYEMASGQRAFGGETAAVVRDAVLNSTPVPLRELNSMLPATLVATIDKALEKDRERRYRSAAQMRADLLATLGRRTVQKSRRPLASRRWELTAAVVLLVIAVCIGLWVGRAWKSSKAQQLTDKDTIVLADFDNKTGDAVFDETLKQGLSVLLGQSPFLEIVSERKVNQTLKLMGRQAGDSLTPEVAREVCQRAGSKAMLTGSISGLGSQYLISLKAVSCTTGNPLAEAREQAAGKEGVLKALDKAAVSVRSKLGESLSSVEKYATPLEQATTPSLEALKAYGLGRKTRYAKGDTAALPFYKRAVELDPNFAWAYQSLATTYGNRNQGGLSAENARKAYALRDKVSEEERLAIEAYYYQRVTGELEKAAEASELWQNEYPKNVSAYSQLAIIYCALGNHERVLEEDRGAVRLAPNFFTTYQNLAAGYINLNQLDEAEAVYKQAEERKLVSAQGLLQDHYLLAFLEGDTTQMAQLATSAMGKPGTEDLLLATEADTEAWHGKLKKARALTERAIDSAQRNDAQETAATYLAAAALREVEAGNREQARAEAHTALKLGPSRDVLEFTALALARAGDAAEAQKMAAELAKTFPLNTTVQKYWLPTIRAAVALRGKDPNHAVELLKVASEIELGGNNNTGLNVVLIPAYLRGEAYLMLHDGSAAAVEFQKFVDHYGLVVNFPLGALARLGLARAFALQGDAVKTRAKYQDFFTLWKDADPDIPVLKEAKAEYAKLH
jgi:serine/threonine protein kinase/tetratricopeptide (TPR) repeat protein